jgi:hypothetical protein
MGPSARASRKQREQGGNPTWQVVLGSSGNVGTADHAPVGGRDFPAVPTHGFFGSHRRAAVGAFTAPPKASLAIRRAETAATVTPLFQVEYELIDNHGGVWNAALPLLV